MCEGIAHLGVYGNWIMRFGKELDQDDPVVIRIMKAYQMFYDFPEHCIIAILMCEIDTYIKEHPEQPLPKGYK